MTESIEHWIERTVVWLTDSNMDALPYAVQEDLEAAPGDQIASFVGILAAHAEYLERNPQRARVLMQLLAAKMTATSAGANAEDSGSSSIDVEDLVGLYNCLSVDAPEAAAHTLQCLAASNDLSAAEALADIISESPPNDWQYVGLGLSPLWRATPEYLETFFARLTDASIHPATLAVLLDLSNHSVRSHLLDEHPWTNRSRDLSNLLSQVTTRLRQLEKDPASFGDSVEQVQNAIGESLSLVVSLCDSLGMIGDAESADVLREAMTLSHRRVQCESACALARLGEESGKNRLIELASDRVARLRAVNYAEELGFANQIDPELQYPQALAESELAAWLASPAQFAFPPSDIELLDTRTQYWPSYEEPQDCYLFRYTYKLPTGNVSNVGIAGPCTQAFTSDLANLPFDDIYAAFAGWQAEHDEVYEVPPTQYNTAQRRVSDTLQAHLDELDLESVRPVALTFFFGEIALLALVEQDGRKLCAVTDGEESLCLPVSDRPTSLTPEVVLCIFRGRKLLRSFNI